ncbi:hypothetical protein [Faecalibacter bovis]|uniref:Uncharacterized protein n=1 Tax=Faecalibacter bovis TaxID=2898187 RepID=A0ABX7XDS7_9FLAO|nr:hypothetical protein [Faecalibacter bovis]QTV06037.1 hypothetical protein J9309_01430 [Faecalibacter bovis]
MIGKKFILTSDFFEGQIIYTFTINGNLKNIDWDYEAVKDKNTLNFFYDNIPKNVDYITKWVNTKTDKFFVQEIPTDLSFDRFWSDYDYKVGKKKMAENCWKKMTTEDKVKALLYISKLKDIKRKEGSDMPYPTTYLNQRYFDV